MSKRACRARTAAPVAMEMSRRFMGRPFSDPWSGSEARVASSAPPRRHPQAGGGGLRPARVMMAHPGRFLARNRRTQDSAPNRLPTRAHHEAGKARRPAWHAVDDLFREERAAAGPPARACARQGKAHSGPKEPDQHHLDRLERVARLAEVGVGVKRVTATDNHFVVTSAVAASLLIGANRHSSWREGIHSLHVGI
jgi:hypothetical protein